MSGSEVEIPQAELRNGIMHIPITGPIGMGLGKFEKGQSVPVKVKRNNEVITVLVTF